MTDQWYYLLKGKQLGPIAFAVLEELVRNGHLGPDGEIWRQGTPDWTRVRHVRELNTLCGDAEAPAGSGKLVAAIHTRSGNPKACQPVSATKGETVKNTTGSEYWLAPGSMALDGAIEWHGQNARHYAIFVHPEGGIAIAAVDMSEKYVFPWPEVEKITREGGVAEWKLVLHVKAEGRVVIRLVHEKYPRSLFDALRDRFGTYCVFEDKPVQPIWVILVAYLGLAFVSGLGAIWVFPTGPDPSFFVRRFLLSVLCALLSGVSFVYGTRRVYREIRVRKSAWTHNETERSPC
jgi:hypothetical protein